MHLSSSSFHILGICTVKENPAAVSQFLTEGKAGSASSQALQPTHHRYREELGSSSQLSCRLPVVSLCWHIWPRTTPLGVLRHMGSHLLHGALQQSFTCSLPRQQSLSGERPRKSASVVSSECSHCSLPLFLQQTLKIRRFFSADFQACFSCVGQETKNHRKLLVQKNVSGDRPESAYGRCPRGQTQRQHGEGFSYSDAPF